MLFQSLEIIREVKLLFKLTKSGYYLIFGLLKYNVLYYQVGVGSGNVILTLSDSFNAIVVCM